MKRLVWILLGALLLGGVVSVLAAPLIERGLAWYEMRRHFQNCQTLQLLITKFYVDHHGENPLPVASFATLRDGGYIDAAFIKYLNKDEGVYCFITPPSPDPDDPVIGYYSEKDTVIFSVNGKSDVFHGGQENPAPSP